MADAFTQIYVQIVFAVKWRQCLILPAWQERLYQYTTGIIQSRNHKLLAIGGMEDHIHIFIGMKPSESISDLVREIKKATNEFVNANCLTERNFQWQNGYGAFSYHRRDINRICNYIQNQKEHHKRQTFKEEFQKLLNDFGIESESKTSFDF
ncbi:MAG: IS200/IS605 family transposase [Saprospiraceae bacterium]|nr:IS200/IS605 family transposase [Saprospiraceae bacterium]